MKRRKRGLGQACYWCKRRLEPVTSNGSLAATKDHYLPRRHGGRNTVWCCRFCNNLKGGVTLQQWLEFIVTTPEWWTHKQQRACDLFRRKFHHW